MVGAEVSVAEKQLGASKPSSSEIHTCKLCFEGENLNFILNVFKQPLSNMEYCYLMQASILKNDVDVVRNLIEMSPYKDSADMLVKSQIAEGAKCIRKYRKPWEK